jgi:hypothetical protein
MSVTSPVRREVDPEAAVPSRLSWWVFAGKRWALRLRRRIGDLASGPPQLGRTAASEDFPHQAGVSLTALWIETNEAERRLERGKVENLRMAAAALDGVVIPAGAVFSFWRQVGPPVARRGFVEGRMLQQGCMVASVGGGLCQLSNGLYDVALQAGCAILERHRHSRAVPGSQAQRGRDATVAWNDVDLRFRAPVAMRLDVRLDDDSLSVTLSRQTPPDGPGQATDIELEPLRAAASSCATCGRSSCRLHEGQA